MRREEKRRRKGVGGIVCISMGPTVALSPVVDINLTDTTPTHSLSNMGSLGLIVRVSAIITLVGITTSGLLVGRIVGKIMGLAPTCLAEAINSSLTRMGLGLVEMIVVILVEIIILSVEITTIIPISVEIAITTTILVGIATPTVPAEITIGGDPGEANNVTSGRNSPLSCLMETNLVNYDITVAFDYGSPFL